MDCNLESYCWAINVNPPEIPPPPPIPWFLQTELNAWNVSDTCDLCSWVANSLDLNEGKGQTHLSSLLITVAIVSALAGAGISAAILSFRRLRTRQFESNAGSMRHLARKYNRSAYPSTSTVPSYMTAGLAENPYCEGPYNDNKECPNNIYAELHSPTCSGTWARPSATAPVENCYLELNEIPVHLNPQTRDLHCSPVTVVTRADYSPCSSAYYSDLDAARPALPNRF